MVTDSDRKRPVIIGVGQCIHRPAALEQIKKPLDLIEMAIREAEQDSTIKSLREQVDTLCLVNILSQPPDGLPAELSRRIAAKPKNQEYTWIGATAPQWFVNRAAEKLFAGQAGLVLICGGEAFSSAALDAKVKGARGWELRYPPKKPWMTGDLRDPFTPMELRYGLTLPIHFYPLFENALRYHEGLSIEQHKRELGEFCSGLSRIAAKNPFAWFPQSKTSDEIVRVSESNRMISFPYTKSMCSIMQVDQAAALFLTDVQTATKLGVPREKWVFLLGSGDASDIWYVSERLNFHSSPSVKVAADNAMDRAGVSLQDIHHFDLYSCFPCAPRITRDMLGIAKNDPRPLTVTGGMPYFGGPGNNYSLHGICRMAELLRHDPSKIGMVQALSWFISKHSVGIYSGEPGANEWNPGAFEGYEAELKQLKGPNLVKEAEGSATVETYTLFHDRDGRPQRGVIVGRLDDGARFLANIGMDAAIRESIVEKELIGTRGRVRSRGGLNIFEA